MRCRCPGRYAPARYSRATALYGIFTAVVLAAVLAVNIHFYVT